MPALETPARIAAACAAAAIALAGALAAPAPAAADDPSAPTPLALTVDATADDADAAPGDGTCATAADACTLRAAIQEVNGSDAGGAIAFDLPDPAGVNVIAPQTALPPITKRVEINGFTQTGATMPTADAPAQLRVELRGTDTGIGGALPLVHGLELAAGSDESTIRGLAIGGFRGYGVRVVSDLAWIAGNHLGLGADGKVAPNRFGGIELAGASDTCIGGDAVEDRNVISGNWRGQGEGIHGEGGAGTVVMNNVVGPDPAGTAKPVNASGEPWSNQLGVRLKDTTGAEVIDNLVSANATNGIQVDGGADVIVQGNVVGLAPSTERRLGNGLVGVLVNDSPGARIGGSAPGEGNVVGGNTGTGIAILGTLADGVRVLGNRVGVDRTGTKGDDGDDHWLGNDGVGILVSNAPNVRIGEPGAGNVVGMNGWAEQLSGRASGITVNGSGATGAVLQGNMIGVDAAGSKDHVLGNLGTSVRITGAPAVTIGGTGDGEGNVIAFSGMGPTTCCNVTGLGGSGIALTGADASGATIQGNRIGTDATGTIALGGSGNGIGIDEGVTDTLVGGADAGAGNVIVTRTPRVPGGSSLGIATSGARTTISGNLIGTDITGTKKLENERCGISIRAEATGTVVGGDTAAHGNVIGGSGVDGIESGAADVVIRHNLIGIGRDDAPLTNLREGVLATGDRLLVADNVVSGNGHYGVVVTGGAGVRVTGNRIGTDAAGEHGVPNTGAGLWVVKDPDDAVTGLDDAVVGGSDRPRRTSSPATRRPAWCSRRTA